MSSTTAPLAADSPWPRLLLLYACGVLAAAQLGKLSALAPLLVPALALSLTTMAWAISLLELGGATLGTVAALLTQRLGQENSLRAALALLVLAGVGQASVDTGPALLAWRVLEAAGYLGVTVSVPVLLVRQAQPHGAATLASALALWSSFVPVGLALGAAAAAGLAQPLGWRGALLACAAAGFLLALRVWQVVRPVEKGPAYASASAKPSGPPPGDAPGGSRAAMPPIGPSLALALAFGLFALFEVGLLALLPTLLVQQMGLGTAAAGAWTGVASASAVLGSAVGAVLMRRGVAPRWPLLWSLGLPALLLFGLFRPQPAVGMAIVLAVLINLLGGVAASLAFTLLPRVAGSHPAGLVRANGLIAQCGASGSLLGPPLMAAGVQWGGGAASAQGWTAAAALGLLVSLAALPLAWRASAPPARRA